MERAKNIHVTPDATNKNNLRVHSSNYGQICKVYGFNPEETKAKADLITTALDTQPDLLSALVALVDKVRDIRGIDIDAYAGRELAAADAIINRATNPQE